MSQRPEHPFYNYQPPPVGEILDPKFRQMIIDNKIGNIATVVKEAMLDNGGIEYFVAGKKAFNLKYNCSGLAFLCGIDLDDPDFNKPRAKIIPMITDAIEEGLEQSVQAADWPGTLNAYLSGGFHEDGEPNIVKIEIKPAMAEDED